jgi:hypothetical protein
MHAYLRGKLSDTCTSEREINYLIDAHLRQKLTMFNKHRSESAINIRIQKQIK